MPKFSLKQPNIYAQKMPNEFEWQVSLKCHLL